MPAEGDGAGKSRQQLYLKSLAKVRRDPVVVAQAMEKHPPCAVGMHCNILDANNIVSSRIDACSNLICLRRLSKEGDQEPSTR